MTNEEAIDLLRMIEFENAECNLGTWYHGIDGDMKEALEMAIKVLEQELCTDAISRTRLKEVFHRNVVCGEVYDELIDAQPSVSVAEKTGRCRDCKWWKDSDGVYRRGIRAESRCPINTVSVANGVGYCYMFKPKESGVEE